MSTQIRLPADLHEQLRELADREERSLNNLMVRLLREGIERRLDTADRETSEH